MNEEVKALWLAALRSGEYAQGKHVLGAKGTDGPDEFCCLGVLCELAVNAGIIPEPHIDYTTEDATSLHYDGSWDTPPDRVVQWAGLEEANPNVLDEEWLTLKLSELNDEYEYDFEQIAHIIEAQL